jgi:hypothetical protein
MFDDFLKSRFDIEVKEIDGIFEANSLLFPEAVGIGSTEKEAIENLADTIAANMSTTIKSIVESLINTETISKNEKKVNNKFGSIEMMEDFLKDKDPLLSSPISIEISDLFNKKSNLKGSRIPILKKGIMIMGLRPASTPENYRNFGNISNSQANSFNDMVDSVLSSGMFDHQDMTGGIKTPEGMLLGIPISFN